MKNQRGSNLIWPVLIIGIGIVMFLISANVIPDAIGDVLIRSWPALLIIFGLNVLIGQRVRFANWVILGLGVVLVIVIANFAYAERSSEYRTDYKESRLDVLPPEVTALDVIIDVRETRVTLSSSPAGERIVDARFAGSNESDVDIAVDIQDTIGVVDIRETRPGVLPRLNEVGRGTLNVFLPTDIPIRSLTYVGDNGSVTANLTNFTIQSINMLIKRGNMKLCLPQSGALIQDAIQLDNGNLELIIPADTTLRFDLGDGASQPTYVPAQSENAYQLLIGGILETRLIDNPRVILNVNVDGELTLDHASTCE